MSTYADIALREIVKQLADFVSTVQEHAKMTNAKQNQHLSLGTILHEEISTNIKRKQQAEKESPKQQLQARQSSSKQYQPKNNSKKKPKAIKYSSYPLEFKKNLISEIKKQEQSTGVKLNKLIRRKGQELGIHPKNIIRWYNTEDLREKRGNRKAQFPEMEYALKQFILHHPDLTRKMIVRKARELIKQFDYSQETLSKFRFSKGWYQRFRQRHNLKSIKKSEEGAISSEESFRFYESQDQGEKIKLEEEWQDENQKEQLNIQLKGEISKKLPFRGQTSRRQVKFEESGK